MNTSVTVLTLMLISALNLSGMDDDTTELLDPNRDEATTEIKPSYKDGLRTDMHNHLKYTHRNLISLDALGNLTDTLHLTSVTHVDFSHNKLQTIPATFFNALPNAVFVNLSHNRIDTFCSPIPEHKKLKTLLLHNNAFTKFPLEQLLHAVALKQLTLHNNQITDFGPLTAQNLSLRELWIDEKTADKTKKIIVVHCPNLCAEICKNGTDVQDARIAAAKLDESCSENCKDFSCVGTYIGTFGGAFLGIAGGITPWGILYFCDSPVVPTMYQWCHGDYTPKDSPWLYLILSSGGIFGAIGAGTGLLLGAAGGYITYQIMRGCCPSQLYQKIPAHPEILQQLKSLEKTEDIV